MKKSRVIQSILAIMMAMPMIFAACGDNGGSTAASSSGNGTVKEQGAAASDKPVTIVYTSWGNADEKKSMEEVSKRFTEEHPNVTIEIQMIASDYDAKLTTMVAANDKMDISQLESATIAYPLVEEGKIEKLNSYFESDPDVTLDTYIPASIYYNGEDIVGLTSGLEIFHLFYSKEAFEKAGIAYPPKDIDKAWTWDEFVDVAKRLTLDQNDKNALDPDFDPVNIKQYGVNMGKWWGTWGSFVIANEGYYVTDDGKFGLSQPEAFEALQNIADLANVHHVAPMPTAEKGMPGIDVALSTGQYAMGIDGAWAALTLGNEEINFDVGVLPKMKKLATQSVGGMNSIWAGSEYKKEAWEFLKYLTTPESNLYAYENGNLMPTINEWYTNPELVLKWTDNPAHPSGYGDAVIGMTLNCSVPTPTGIVKNFNKIMELVNPALDEVWLGEKSAEDAMKEIEAQVQPLIQGKRH